MSENEKKPLLEVKDLKVSFFTRAGEVKAVNGISYTVNENEIMGIVGESGSGKSVEAYTVMGLLQSPGKVLGGEVLFEGQNLLNYTKKEMREFRGNRAAMIFQNPMTSLNPVYTIEKQMGEALKAHHPDISKEEIKKRILEMLVQVGINNPERRMKQYPHEFSGGMRQRVMIAMGLICNPKLLIADEPTTALDVTIQAQILELMKNLQKQNGMGIIFITHNLGVVAGLCDKVSVMYAGRIVEQGTVDDIFYKSAHPYTAGLLKAVPRADMDSNERLISIKGQPVDVLHLPMGCPYAERCEHCSAKCHEKLPPYADLGDGHIAACWLLNPPDPDDQETLSEDKEKTHNGY